MARTTSNVAEILRLPDSARALQEASEWVARLQGNGVSAADWTAFERWRTADAVNARAYEEISSTWRTLLRAGPLVRAVSFGSAMEHAVTSPARSRPWMHAAGAVGVALVATVVAWYQGSAGPQTRFETAIGEHVRVALPDGSSLELNSNTRARIEYSAQTRVIRLERGEAFFDVAHDATRPFWVVARESWVRAVGTSFAVYLKPAAVEVTVSAGSVNVVGRGPRYDTPSDAAVAGHAVAVLKAGERAKVSNGQAAVYALATGELARAEAWRLGSVYFDDQPLGEVVDEMQRYTSMQIELADATLRARRVGGSFQSNSAGVEAMLTMLEDGLGLSVTREEDDRVYIEAGRRR